MSLILDPSIQIARHISVETTQSRSADNHMFVDLYPTARSNYLKFAATFTDDNAEKYTISMNRMPSPVNLTGHARCAIYTVEITSNKTFYFINTLVRNGQTNVYPAGTSVISILVAELGSERDAFILTP